MYLVKLIDRFHLTNSPQELATYGFSSGPGQVPIVLALDYWEVTVYNDLIGRWYPLTTPVADLELVGVLT